MKEQSNDVINAALGMMTSKFGTLYLWGEIAAVGLLMWLTMTRLYLQGWRVCRNEPGMEGRR
jgi:choline-glycine betaine transporter